MYSTPIDEFSEENTGPIVHLEAITTRDQMEALIARMRALKENKYVHIPFTNPYGPVQFVYPDSDGENEDDGLVGGNEEDESVHSLSPIPEWDSSKCEADNYFNQEFVIDSSPKEYPNLQFVDVDQIIAEDGETDLTERLKSGKVFVHVTLPWNMDHPPHNYDDLIKKPRFNDMEGGIYIQGLLPLAKKSKTSENPIEGVWFFPAGRTNEGIDHTYRNHYGSLMDAYNGGRVAIVILPPKYHHKLIRFHGKGGTWVKTCHPFYSKTPIPVTKADVFVCNINEIPSLFKEILVSPNMGPLLSAEEKKKRKRARAQRPEVKAKARERAQRPEVKAKARERAQRRSATSFK